ncbi:MOSC domain-containing protein [Roseibacillus persicicus]|uniref:MOSC domain-containing protein n=1 Tax=Roseibacillus persicicus TaxID=454148 RepID=UPI0028107039|nr:MOSC domain-containing protein [Roseibacillus persicicus]MDQ8189696.1 molybdenum cofactor biosysynthesis protein [Roseibacillus persicicus]
MKSDGHPLEVKHIFVSPGHDFRGRHGLGREDNGVVDCDEVELVAGSGIVGDRYFNHKEDFKGQITFFEESVWLAVKEKFALPELPASEFRRNVIVSGVDLNSLIGQQFAIGDLEFSGSEEASPCYWMDEACAPGVEEFLRGRGGLRCRILGGGTLAKGTFDLRVLGAV